MFSKHATRTQKKNNTHTHRIRQAPPAGVASTISMLQIFLRAFCDKQKREY